MRAILTTLLSLLFITAAFSQNCEPEIPDTVCQFELFQVFGNVEQSSDVLWDFGDGSTSNLKNPSKAYNESGNYVIVFTRIEDGLTECDTSIFIHVKPATNINVTFLSDDTLCFENNLIQLIDSSIIDSNSQIIRTTYKFSDGGQVYTNDPIMPVNINYNFIDQTGGYFDLIVYSELENGCISKREYQDFVLLRPKIGAEISVEKDVIFCDSLELTIKGEGRNVTNELKKFQYSLNDSIILEGDRINNNEYWNKETFDVVLSGKRDHAIKLIAETVFGCKDSFTYINRFNVPVNSKVFVDLDKDCELDSLEPGFPALIKTNFSRITTSSSGDFDLNLFYGDTVRIEPGFKEDEINLVKSVCPPFYEFSLDTINQCYINDSFHFAVQIEEIPKLESSISTDPIRRCRRSKIYVNYQNKGLAPQTNVQLKVRIPKSINIIGADRSYTQQDDILTFELGTLQPFQQGKVTIIDSLDCINGLLNNIKCFESWLTPPNHAYERLLYETEPGDSSFMHIRATAVDTGRIIVIKNIGEDMRGVGSYNIYNSSPTYQGSFILNAGDSTKIFLNDTNSRHIHISVVNDSAFFRARSYSLNIPSKYSIVKEASTLDQTADHSRWCTRVIGSYDPNDKQVWPSISDVPMGTKLDYTIRFQNTGNDTAFLVRVDDVLPAQMDISTLKITGESHPMTWKLTKNGNSYKISFLFEDINLVAKAEDEDLSQGFVSFSMEPNDNMKEGTYVNNKAFIYFDINDPIITNTTSTRFANSENNGTGEVIVDGELVKWRSYKYDTFCGYYVSPYSNSIYEIDGTFYDTLSITPDSVAVFTLRTVEFDPYIIKFNDTLFTLAYGDAYQWLRCDQDYKAIENATDSRYTIPEDGSYTVVVSKLNCIDTVECFTAQIATVNDPTYGKILIYPNPFRTEFTLNVNSNLVGKEIFVYDSKGQLVLNEKIKNLEHQVKLPDSPAGIYFVKLSDQTAIRLIKLGQY